MLVNLSRSQFCILLLVTAVAIRFGAALMLRDVAAGPDMAFGKDGKDFDELAAQLASGNGYCWRETGVPTSFRAPGFPLFLSVIYLVAGQNHVLAYASFAALGALACLFVYLLMAEVRDERTGRWAAVLTLLYLPHIYFATVFASENLFVACLAAGLWAFARYLKHQNIGALTGVALAIGICTLTRPVALLFVPVLLLAILWASLPPLKLLGHAAVLTTVFCATVLPWSIRNQRVHGQFVLVATNGGSTFYGSNNDRVLNDPDFFGGWISTVHLPGREFIEAASGEVAHDKREWELGKQWVNENVSSLPLLLLYKFSRMWLPDTDSPNRKYVLLQIAGYTPIFLLLVVGIFCCARKPELQTPMWLVLHGSTLATIAAGLIFWGSPRFRDANLPALIAYAAVGLEAVTSHFALRTSHFPRPTARPSASLSGS